MGNPIWRIQWCCQIWPWPKGLGQIVSFKSPVAAYVSEIRMPNVVCTNRKPYLKNPMWMSIWQWPNSQSQIEYCLSIITCSGLDRHYENSPNGKIQQRCLAHETAPISAVRQGPWTSCFCCNEGFGFWFSKGCDWFGCNEGCGWFGFNEGCDWFGLLWRLWLVWL